MQRSTAVGRKGSRALISVLFLSYIFGCGQEQPVAEPDKALFLRPADLGAYGVRHKNPEAYESFSKKKHFDGSYELQYEFNAAAEGESLLFINIGVSVQRKASDAALTEKAEEIGMMIGLKKGGVEEREVTGFPPYGDSTRFVLLVMNGKLIGNSFVAHNGKKTYRLIMVGLYFEDPEDWQKVIGPKLQQLAGYSPE